MNISFECNVDKDVLENFTLALTQNKEEADKVVEKYMKQYISNSLSKVIHIHKKPKKAPTKAAEHIVNPELGKASSRIPKWALSPDHSAHKIIKAFFQLESILGFVPLEELEKICSNKKKHRATYVKDFRANFHGMHIDTAISHGKVFIVNKGNVIIWNYVKATLMEYKEYF